MPQLVFPQGQVNTPTGVANQQGQFQGFANLGQGLQNLGYQDARAKAAAQKAAQSDYQKSQGYLMYLESSTAYKAGLRDIEQRISSPREQAEAADEFTQKHIQEFTQRSAEAGLGDEWLKHAVPYTISAQEKFLNTKHGEIHDYSVSVMEAEGNVAVQQAVNEGVGFTVQSQVGGANPKLTFDDNTQEVMGTILHAYADSVTARARDGVTPAEMSKQIQTVTKSMAKQVGQKAASANPQAFKDIDPTKEFTITMPLFDLDGGFRSYDVVMDQEDVADLRDFANKQLAVQRTEEAAKHEAEKRVINQATDITEDTITQGFINRMDPQFLYDQLDQAAQRGEDVGRIAKMRAHVDEYYRARAGDPNEPMPPEVEMIDRKIRLGGTVGENAIGQEELMDLSSYLGMSQAHRTALLSTWNSRRSQDTTKADQWMAKELDHMEKRFVSIVKGQSPYGNMILTDSVERLGNEVAAQMEAAFEAIPPEKRTFEEIRRVAYEAQIQALPAVFETLSERMEPKDQAALGRMLNSQLPQGKPSGMDTRDWVLKNVMAGRIKPEDAPMLNFMTEFYNLNNRPSNVQALEAQQPREQNFPEYEVIQRMQGVSNEEKLRLAEEYDALKDRRQRQADILAENQRRMEEADKAVAESKALRSKGKQ